MFLDRNTVQTSSTSLMVLPLGKYAKLPSWLHDDNTGSDPYPDSVILWTRASPMFANVDDNSTVSGTVPLFGHGIYNKSGVTTAPICVDYKVSEDRSFTDVVDSGTAYTSSDIDYTVKVEAKNLEPFTSYFYQFSICGSNNTSPIGRTKTTPLPEDETANVGLAVYSCSNFRTCLALVLAHRADSRSIWLLQRLW